MNNIGDPVHRQVIDTGILPILVKIVKKKVHISLKYGSELFLHTYIYIYTLCIYISIFSLVSSISFLFDQLYFILSLQSDLPVREKIFLLLDAAQTSVGGPTGRYPQYYSAYYELVVHIQYAECIVTPSSRLFLSYNLLPSWNKC